MTIDPLTGLIQWTPSIADAGDHSVTVRMTDTGELSATQTFIIALSPAPVNKPPVVINDYAETLRNTPVTINLLLNDYDPDGSLLPGTVVITTAPTQGRTVTNNADGTVTYTPPANFKGTDIFYYSVQDNQGASGEAMVSVNIVNRLKTAGSLLLKGHPLTIGSGTDFIPMFTDLRSRFFTPFRLK